MANRRITELPAISSAQINNDDLLMVVDVAEVDPGLKNKKLTFADTKQYLNGYYLQLSGGTLGGSLIVGQDLIVSGSFLPDNINAPGTGTFSYLVVNSGTILSGVTSGVTFTGQSFQAVNFNAVTGNISNLTVETATVDTGNFTRVSGATITGTAGAFASLTGQTITGATGLFSNFSGTNITGVNGIFTTQVSGSVITGNAVRASNITGISGVFTTRLSGATITGDIVQASNITGVSGVFTTSLSGNSITGATGLFANLTGVSGTFTTRVSGATVTGATGLFTNITGSLGAFTTSVSGAVVTGNTAQFTQLTGVSGVFTTQVSGASITGNAGSFANITGVSGVFTTRLSGATVTGVSGLFQRIEALTGVFTDSILIPSINTTGNITAAGNLNVSGNGTISSGLIVSGVISGGTVTGVTGAFTILTANEIYGLTSISGNTVTGASGNFTTARAVSGIFTTTLSGSVITGNTINATTGNFVTGLFSVVSGDTVTGNVGQFTNLTGVSGTFTNRVSGTTFTGATGYFGQVAAVTGVFTSRVSGAVITGDTGQFTSVTGQSGIFTSVVSGATVTGTAGSFVVVTGVSGVFTSQISGASITGVSGFFTQLNAVNGSFSSQISGQNIVAENGTFNYVTGSTRVEGGVVSGGTVTGNLGLFTNLTGVSGTFTSRVSGAYITGVTIEAVTVTATTGNFTIANFTQTTTGNILASGSGIFGSGVFTPGTISGATGLFTSLLSGATITGINAQFTTVTGVSGIFTSQLSGTTVTGTTANFTSGKFINISGGIYTITSGVFASGSATNPSISFVADLNCGVYSPGADQVAISTNGTRRLLIDSTGALTLDTGDATINNTRVGRGGGAITSNTALGAAALNANTTGNNSTALGFEALTTNTTGFGNAADGYQALRNNTTGAFNTAIGAAALKNNTTGYTNTAIGQAALTNNTTGENNTCLGATAGQDLTTGSNNTIIGRINGTAGLSGTVIIGAGSTERLRIDSSGRLLVGTSTARSGYHGGNNHTPFIQIETSGSANRLVSITTNGTNWYDAPSLNLSRSRASSVGGTTIVQSNDQLGNLSFNGYDGAVPVVAAEIAAFVDGTPGTSDMPGRLVFSTTSDGAVTPTERMRIDSTGQIEANSLGTAAAPVWTFLSDPNTGIYSPNADQLAITTSGTQKFTLDSLDGNPIIENQFPVTVPTLDLAFALTKQLDPRITFSRASSGTYVDVNGVIQSAPSGVARFDHNPTTGESLGLLVEEARTNSLTLSEDFTQWTGSAFVNVTKNVSVLSLSAIAPNGSITATKVVLNSGQSGDPNNANLFRYLGGTGQSGAWVSSVYIKNAGIDKVRFYYGNALGNLEPNIATAVEYTFSTDTVTRLAGNTGGGAVASRELLANGWVRISLYRPNGSDTSATSGLWITFTSAATGNGTNGVFVWGAQLEAGSFPTSYIPTPATFTSRASTATFYDANGVVQTAATNVARSNAFFPDSNGVMRPAGLLLEGSGTNLLTYSEGFNISPWSISAAVTANAGVAPDGASTADQISGGRVQREDITYAANTTYTFSLFVKGAAGQTLGIGRFIAGSDGDVVLSYTTLTGNWQRLTYTFTSPITASSSRVLISGAGDKSGTATNFLVWGAQLETGPYPTSYIPTTTATVTRAADVSSSATVTRSADVAQITGTNFSSWYNNSQGSLYGDWRIPASAKNNVATAVGFGNNGNNGFLRHPFGTTSSSRVKQAIGLTNFSVGNAATPANQISAVNGTIGGSGANIASPTYPVDLQIGNQPGGSNYLNGTIARLTYWPTRLSDATLQTITA